MAMKKYKIIILSTLLIATITSCVNDDDYSAPEIACVTKDVTKNVSDVSSLTQSNYQQWIEDDVIEAYVTSSDEGGNFYKSISLVSVDGSVGFSMPIDATGLFWPL